MRGCGSLHCDRIWLSCYALHNIVLDTDGLYKKKEEGLQLEWETQDDNEIGMPNVIRKLFNPSIKRIPDRP